MRPTSSFVLVLLASLLAACDPDSPDKNGGSDTDVEPDAPFTLALATDRLPVLQGTSATLEVTVTRGAGFAGDVTLSVEGLPDGVAAVEDLTVPAGEDHATIELVAAADAPHSLPTEVTVRGASDGVEVEELVTVTVYGPPGTLDTSFAGGFVVAPAGASDDYAYAVAIQPDGKVVLAGTTNGDFAVMRLDRDGAVDTTFGVGGVVTTDIGTGDVANAVAVLEDGRIVVAGSTTGAETGEDFAVVRYAADGSLDTSFGDGGIVTTSFSTDSDTAYAVVLQDDGAIVVGGEMYEGNTSGVDFALARYLSDGNLDPSFGTGGKVTTSIAAFTGRDTIYALALDGDGRVVAAGGEGDFSVARYLDDGELDPDFGEAGRVSGLFGSTIGAARAVQVDTDGSIVVAGHSHHDFALARLDDAGELDAAFGEDGTVLTAVSETNWDEARGLAIDEDGNLVVAGWTYEGNSSAGDFAVVRYDGAGALDEAFGIGGVVVTPGLAANKRDEAAGVAMQVDDRVPTVRIVAAGSASDTNSDFAVARYWR